jgi:hypothetical protein
VRIRLPRRWEWLIVGLIAAVLLLLLLQAVQVIDWVGQTDLEVEFAVADAATGGPVPGAAIDIHSEGGFYEERQPRDFRLVAGADGRASYLCRGSMCFGRDGLLRHTFAVHLPWWQFRVSAPGYEPTEPVDLDVLEFRRAARPVGPGRSKLVVPVSLHR